MPSAADVMSCVPEHPGSCVSDTVLDRSLRAARVMSRYVGPQQLSGGVVAVGDGSSDIAFSPVGTTDRNSTIPSGPDTLYRLYCMTKPLTGLAIARLIAEGRLSLDDEISRHLPELAHPLVQMDQSEMPASRPITIRDLLAHTSGITMPLINRGELASRYLENGLLAARVEIEAITGAMRTRPRDSQDYLERLSSLPLAFQPGTNFSYGLSYDLLGFLIERLTGESIMDHLSERILHPLGMTDTMLVVEQQDLHRLATGYYRFDVAPPGQVPRYERSEPEGRNIYSTVPPYVDAGNGLVSSARDYSRFLDAVIAPSRHQGSLRNALEMLPRDLLPSHIDGGPICEAGGYAIGGYVIRHRMPRRPSPGTYGWSGFGGTYFWVDFEAGYWMLLMMQYGPASSLGIKPRVISTQYR